MSFTASDVKNLREMTGCGMMDCKRALTETDGDMDKAIDYLREKGMASAAKRSGKIASEGICYTEVKDGVGVLLEVNCESDFVARGEMFLAFVKDVAAFIMANDVETAEQVAEACRTRTNEAIQKIGENIKIRRFVKYVSDETVDSYMHMGGKIGVLVECKKGVSSATIHDVALQIAAAKPSYVKEDEVPQEVLEKEKEILIAQMKNDEKFANKPEAVLANIVNGKLKKYYEENCLLNQSFVKDPSLTVKALLDKENSTVIRFTRYEMGEGLQKKSENLADEVAAQVEAMKK